MPTARPLPPSLVFTRADARAVGWSDSALARAVRSGWVTRLRHNRFTAHAEVGAHELGMAAVQACAGSVLSHRSALLAHGLPILRRAPVPELTVAPRRIGKLASVHIHRATLWPQDVVQTADGPATSVARTLVDVARGRSAAAAVVAADAALRRGLLRPDELVDVLVRCWNWPGIARAGRALELADGRSESPLESISRLVVRWLGLPAPELQAVILDESGRVVGRLDLYWDEFGVGGEADGRSKYTERDVLTREKDRQEDLEDLALVMTRWGWAHASRPAALRTKIESAFERGRARDRSGLPRCWSVQLTEPDRFA